MESSGYLWTAFSLAWALVFGYVLLLINRQRGLRHDIEALKATLKEKEGRK